MWNQREGASSSVADLPSAVAAEHKAAMERRTTAWISKSVIIKGDVISSEDLTIDGRVEGTIAVGDHSLFIGVGAGIQADLKAHTIIISGAVIGNVTATERIEIRETGSVDGDITGPRLTLRDGAIVRGRIDTFDSAKNGKK